LLRTALVIVVTLGAAGWVAWRARGEPRVEATPPGAGVGATIGARFTPPAGFERAPLPGGSFGAYLRALPLRPAGTPVRLHDGTLKKRQDVHAAVLDQDLGPRDLQQCADSVMRLRAEFLHGSGHGDAILFHFTSGFPCGFARWRRGERPRVRGNDVAWVTGGAADASPAALGRYLDVVYAYAGTRSLPRDLVRVPQAGEVEVGDVYLKPGSPGHAMIVVDLALAPDGRRAVLLAQGYMPAQEVHVVRNLADRRSSPWFVVGQGSALCTPEWTCGWGELWRFPPTP
jgi:hypothetical protein